LPSENDSILPQPPRVANPNINAQRQVNNFTTSINIQALAIAAAPLKLLPARGDTYLRCCTLLI
jgi:hypothetical protein